MRYTRAASLAVAVSLFGCAEGSDKSVTAPSVRNIVVVAPAPCDASIAATVNAQQPQLFNGQILVQAERLWDHVEIACPSNLTGAREQMLAYVQFTIDQQKLGNVKTPAANTAAEALLTHWDYVFPYVDYPSPNLPASVFGPEGAAGVITQATANRELAAANAAITVPVQLPGGDQRPHLFVIHPLPDGCLEGTNLAQAGPCFEFASFPAVSPEFNPQVKVGICQPLGEGEDLDQGAPALGHLTGGVVKIPSPQQYPTFCEHDDFADAGSWKGGLAGVTRRVAHLARALVGVQPLYAVHGGLGGLGKGLSPFGGVDLVTFEASLSGQTIGAPPSADAGSWTQIVTHKATATVEQSLGSYADTVIVLQRACVSCGALLLRANLFAAEASSSASLGIYDVSWVSLQGKAIIQSAPFVLRGSNGLEIARLTYASDHGSFLKYNGTQVGRWTRRQPQQFRVRVNLDTRKTSLFINGVLVAADQDFVEGATDLASIAAELSEIDAGQIGWAEISVQRLPDE